MQPVLNVSSAGIWEAYASSSSSNTTFMIFLNCTFFFSCCSGGRLFRALRASERISSSSNNILAGSGAVWRRESTDVIGGDCSIGSSYPINHDSLTLRACANLYILSCFGVTLPERYWLIALLPIPDRRDSSMGRIFRADNASRKRCCVVCFMLLPQF